MIKINEKDACRSDQPVAVELETIKGRGTESDHNTKYYFRYQEKETRRPPFAMVKKPNSCPVAEATSDCFLRTLKTGTQLRQNKLSFRSVFLCWGICLIGRWIDSARTKKTTRLGSETESCTLDRHQLTDRRHEQLSRFLEQPSHIRFVSFASLLVGALHETGTHTDTHRDTPTHVRQ